MASAQEFEDRVADTQSGADEVQDFALKSSYAFPSADVLVPAPMAVSILGQLTLVATAADFNLTKPSGEFTHIRYPDSFRATITQLVNTGCLALNKSFVNFDEINKRCGAIRPGVNNIIQLLVGHEGNTPRENDLAIERHLPNQINALSRTIQACLDKAQETDNVFNGLLELTMEIHEACTATQEKNDSRVREAKQRQEILAREKEAAEKMREISQEVSKQAREDFVNAQQKFNEAVDSTPGEGFCNRFRITSNSLLQSTVSAVTFGLVGARKRSSGGPDNAGMRATSPPEPSVDMSDALDPAYHKASSLRNYAEMLDTLLVAKENGRLDWNAVKSPEFGGCTTVRVGFEQVYKSIKPNHKHAGKATTDALTLARKGVGFAQRLGRLGPLGSEADIATLTAEVSAWRDQVVAFAATADLKLGTSQLGSNVFLPQPNYSRSGSAADAAVRGAEYRMATTQAQLHASRESSKAATDKLMEVTGNLGEILGQIAQIDVQKQNWEEITGILIRAIDFLCELKKYLNNLVHFFDAVNNLVSVTLKEAADQFIQIVKDTTAIEHEPGKKPKKLGSISLDAWARQAIYNHALSAAKISKVVENISDMYVTLYDSHVHPGVNMLLGMGKLVGSDDYTAVAAAGQEIQDWAKDASDKIVQLVSERMHANERDIQDRMKELESSLGSIVPQTSRIDEIVHRAEQEQVREMTEQIEVAANENPVFQKRKAKAFV
ncbi:hypothetical protein C8Q80DRAFT_1110850 [Daedaleopsis nitida]|nr:hypothetical protein C8Q80DRAFT_1110850 [Daedaleopsis nitida]